MGNCEWVDNLPLKIAVREWVEQPGNSWEQLARVSGYTRGDSVKRALESSMRIRIERGEAIAEAMGTSLSALLRGYTY